MLPRPNRRNVEYHYFITRKKNQKMLDEILDHLISWATEIVFRNNV